MSDITGGQGGVFTDYGQTDSYNFHAGAQISYAYKDLFSFAADATYYHWDADDPNVDSETVNYNDALLMKPQFKLGLQIEARPIHALSLNISYQYISRTEPYFFTGAKLPAVSNLLINIGTIKHSLHFKSKGCFIMYHSHILFLRKGNSLQSACQQNQKTD